jgi:molybdopterin synthase sulfur carrier subunit
MIAVTARYFAAFREQAGQDSETLRTQARTAGELYAEIAAAHGFADAAGCCKVAVNDELVTWETPISDGDTVLLFPPVAGG